MPIIGFLIVATILMYIFVVPSVWPLRNRQMNQFESGVLNEVKQLRADIQATKDNNNNPATRISEVNDPRSD